MKALLLCLVCMLTLSVQAQTAPAGTTATLNWSEPSTTIAYGFNLYRITVTTATCPAFSTSTWTKLVPSINRLTPTWTDTTLVATSTYCYAVTAYDTSGQGGESGPSNLLILPPPSSGGSTIGTPPSPTGLAGTRK